MNEGGRTDPGARETGAKGPASRSAGRGRVRAFAAPLVSVPGLVYAAVPATPVLVVAAGAVFWVAAPLFVREVIPRYRRVFDPRNWSRGTRKE